MSRFHFEDFFHLSDVFADEPLRLCPIDNSIATNRLRSYLLGTEQPAEPLALQVEAGEDLASFLWGSRLWLVCISNEVRNILLESGFSGWTTYPVTIVNGSGNLIEGYSGLVVTGRGGERDFTDSVLIDKPPRSAKGRPYTVIRGFYFDPAEWDKTDIFLVSGSIIIHKSVAEALVKNNATNIFLTPVAQYELREVALEHSNPSILDKLERKRSVS